MDVGKAVEGILHVLPTGYKAGYAETKLGKIALPDIINLNRAFEGDRVVLLLDTQQ